MQIIYNGRGSGKTTQLINMCDNCNRYIVCKDPKESQRIFQYAKKINKNINFPITYSEFIAGSYFAKGGKKGLGKMERM